MHSFLEVQMYQGWSRTVAIKSSASHVVTFLKKFTSCAWKFGYPRR